jgi:hypothetical protein
MRNILILGSITAAVACSGTGGKTKQDSVPTDSAAINAAATLPAPTDSLASRSQATPASSNAKTSPAGPRSSSSAPAASSDKTPAVHPNVTPAASTATLDSVRGTVAVVGTSFEKHVTVAVPGGRRVTITGSLAPMIGRTAGADVSVVGQSAGTSLEATRFVVRTVDGQPAIDGTLKTEGTTLYILTATGTRTRIVSPPPPLVGHDGARVWITGDPSRGVSSFGFIDPAR